MAACGSLQHIFDNPLSSESPRLLDPLSSWNQLQPPKPLHKSSFTEIFGELHFTDTSPVPSSSCLPVVSKSFSSSSLFDSGSQPKIVGGNKNEETSDHNISTMSNKYNRSHKSSDSFSSMNSESLQLCTEGLGFESSGDVEDTRSSGDVNEEWQNAQEKFSFTTKPRFMATSDSQFCGHRKSRSAGVGGFPPPISCISKSGKPWVCFKSYRHDGRFVLKEIRIPTQEFLHAYREGGRLKLHFIHHEDEQQILSEVEREDNQDEADSDEEENSEDDDEDEEDQDEENGDEHADAACSVNEGNEANIGTCSTNEV